MIAEVGSVLSNAVSALGLSIFISAILSMFTLVIILTTSWSYVDHYSSRHHLHVQGQGVLCSNYYPFYQESKTFPRKPVADFQSLVNPSYYSLSMTKRALGSF